MKQAYRLLMSALVLAMGLSVSLPSGVGAKSEGRHKGGRGHSSGARRGHSGRADVRYRDSGGRRHTPWYRSQTNYRYNDPRHFTYRSRPYYTASFHRPRFVHRSGFSIGFVMGSVPSHGYRYFDPYCDMRFSNLDVYYSHCHDHGHPGMIQVLDIRFGYPVASSVYRGGHWVVDDCG